jgi:membrane protease YdiL (CAAX protease family)
MQESLPQTKNNNKQLIIFAWIGTLLVSALPDILWQEAFSGDAIQAIWSRFGFALIWKKVRPLWGYFLILLIIHVVAGIITPLIEKSGIWQGWFNSGNPSWILSTLGVQILRLLVPLTVIAALSIMGLKRHDYLLVKGELDASVEPVRWLGIKKPVPWTRFGRTLAIIITLITLVFLVIGIRPSLSTIIAVLPLLPFVLIFAALNSFNEELPYRAALLSQLLPHVEKGQALLLTSVLFGIGHFYGVPSGMVGVLMAGIFAWLLRKSMVETHGSFGHGSFTFCRMWLSLPSSRWVRQAEAGRV